MRRSCERNELHHSSFRRRLLWAARRISNASWKASQVAMIVFMKAGQGNGTRVGTRRTSREWSTVLAQDISRLHWEETTLGCTAADRAAVECPACTGLQSTCIPFAVIAAMALGLLR
jgi:hypothetical protein